MKTRTKLSSQVMAAYSYKCRFCGQVFEREKHRVFDGDVAGIKLMQAILGKNSEACFQYTIHHCSKIDIGIADLVGCTIYSED